MRKAFKYRLYPTKVQVTAMEEQLETHRRLYNSALAERRDAWQKEQRNVNYYDQAKALTKTRKENEWMQSCFSQSLQATLKRLDKAFQNFFRRVKNGEKAGYPRFKSYGRFDSIEYPQYGSGCKLNTENQCLKLFTIGEVKIKLHRPVEGKIKTVAFKREADHWYAVFSCELPDVEAAPCSLPAVGIDLGLKSFYVTSEGQEVEPPKHFRKSEEKLAKLQRQLAKKKKGSRNRNKARIKVARLHRKIANQRRDFHNKTALDLVRNHGVIAHEKLNVKGIARTRLAKSTHDAGWSQFLGILERKAVEAGVMIVPVDPRNTSQKCSGCGAMPPIKLTLSDRIHKCTYCQQILDRDWNAARNILAAAFA
jgi:putative transposase